MESIIETFHIDWKIIIAQAVNFALVFIILYLFALKPLNKLMQERQLKITKGINDAKENEIILSQTEKNYEETLANARIEAQAIFQNVKREAELKKEEIIKEAREEASLMIENGKKILESEKKKMISDEHEEILYMVMKSTEKLLGEKSDSALNQRSIKEVIDLR